MLEYILTAFSFGLSAVAIPGALQTNLLNVTLRYGWRRGLIIIISPLITDIPIIILMVGILGNLPETALDLIRIFGGLFLFFIAWGAFQQLRAGANFGGSDSDVKLEPPLKTLLFAVGINFLTPGPYIFWGTLNGPILVKALAESWVYAAAFLLAFYTTFIGGLALLVAVFHTIGNISPRVTRTILRFTIVLLIYFGSRLILDGLGVL